ncbi:AI-2E family transporter [Paenibacillus sp. MBLB4367]|uniref:AI-2E family transporter n=1 Tax=Paenibacillus sp. MBLB4367 TaxID=3384767 RepID=UPI003908371A
MPQGKYFRIGYGIALLLLIVFLAAKVDFLFHPIGVVFRTLFFPLFVAGILYYLLRPVVKGLMHLKIPKPLSILLVYVAGFGLIALVVVLAGPTIASQFRSLIVNAPTLISAVQDQLQTLEQNEWIAQYLQQNHIDWRSTIGEYLNRASTAALSSVQSILGFLTNIFIILTTVPFILYYMLSEGDKVPKFILRLLPDERDEDGIGLLREMDNALSAYLQGKVLVSICLGVLLAIGYSIIGLQYTLILAICAMVLNLIPYVGLFIGIIPSIIVAFIDSPSMIVKMLAVVLIAQQIESNFLSPQIMGKKLNIHPLTIILLLLVAGSFGGLLGMFLAVPTFAVAKVIATYCYRLYALRAERLQKRES